jgi:tricorn protease
MKMIQILFVLLLASTAANSQINAKLMRYMDVSDTHITFVYGGDIWVVEKD